MFIKPSLLLQQIYKIKLIYARNKTLNYNKYINL